jgi:hypothetical protein
MNGLAWLEALHRHPAWDLTGSAHHSALTAFPLHVHTPERAIACTPAFAFSRRGDTRHLFETRFVRDVDTQGCWMERPRHRDHETEMRFTLTGDLSTELLHTISEALDIRAIFPRVSEIANHVLPHDWLGLVFQDQSDRVTLRAQSADSFPKFRRLAVAGEDDDQVVGDIEKERVRLDQSDPPDRSDRILAEGYRSFLKVRSVAGDQVMGLGFFSKRSEAYSLADVPVARRIAECISVAVSHEQSPTRSGSARRHAWATRS